MDALILKEHIPGALNPLAPLIEHMGVKHGG